MLGWFVETTLVASGLAVVAALGSRLRSIGPTARHLLWLVVLVKLMTPPLVCWPWAAHWGDLTWPLVADPAAPAAQAPCVDDATTPGPSPEAITLAGLDRIGFRLDNPVDTDLDAPALSRRVTASDAMPGPAARRPDWLAFGWLSLTVLLGVGQASRVIRFRGRLRTAVPAPDVLVEEAGRIGQSLGVRVPELLVVPDLGTPMLWCLGRPKLLLPAQLAKALGPDRWRGILTHELAHIRRGDHWVSRLELAAGLIWWWNPVYWLARARLDAEAELACDAWVVSTLPKDRLAYAEALFNICSTLSMAKAPAPALGAAGSGRFFERRLTMILHDHVPCRLSPLALLVACLLALFALPSWSAARPVAIPDGDATAVSIVPTVDLVSTASIDDDDADDDDDDDDDDDSKAKAKADAKAKAKADAKKAKADAKKAKADAKKAKTDTKTDTKTAKADAKKTKDDSDLSKLGDEMESKFGPDFEKKMEALGEQIEKEIESKFGPDFEKKMEALGEQIGKEMEARFGPGSDFEKKMKELGKEMEARFGPGSDFEKKMKELGKEMEAKFGPGSDFEKKMKEQAETLGSDLKKNAAKSAPAAKGSPKTNSSRETAKAPIAAKGRQRERRIAALEAQIRELAEELKALKADADQD